MSEQIWWYVARSGGIVALFLAFASVLWGLLLTTRLLQGRPSPRWLLDLHRFLGGATVVFTGIHVAGLVLDSYVSFGWSDVLVPMAASWKPGAVAWGVVAMWLLVAVEVTSLVMRHLPKRLWRFVHFGSYAMAWTGLVHGALAGTDATNRVYAYGAALMTLAVFYLTAFRILAVRRGARRASPRPADTSGPDPAAPPTPATPGGTP